MTPFENTLNTCKNLIHNKKNIILLGTGNNGKTYLINTLESENYLKNYTIFHEFPHNTNILSNPYITCIHNINDAKNLDPDSFTLINTNHIFYH